MPQTWPVPFVEDLAFAGHCPFAMDFVVLASCLTSRTMQRVKTAEEVEEVRELPATWNSPVCWAGE
eukprot:549105-Alexandrium_andersonii.AAC.1